MNDEFDIGGEAQASLNQLDVLHKTLEEAIALEEAVAQMEEDLKAAKAALNDAKARRIPDLMDELQMDSVTFRGWTVKVHDFVSGSLPKDDNRRKAALVWLEEHGADGLIKTDLSLSFGKSQHEAAIELARRLEADGFAPSVDSGVHAQTLQAFAREAIRNGEEIDTEILGLFVGKVAKLKRASK